MVSPRDICECPCEQKHIITKREYNQTNKKNGKNIETSCIVQQTIIRMKNIPEQGKKLNDLFEKKNDIYIVENKKSTYKTPKPDHKIDSCELDKLCQIIQELTFKYIQMDQTDIEDINLFTAQKYILRHTNSAFFSNKLFWI